MGRFDSFSRILYPDLRIHFPDLDQDADTPVFRRILHRVVQNIFNGFRRPFPVVADLNGGTAVHRNLDMFEFGLMHDIIDGGRKRVQDPAVFHVRMDHIRFQPGSLQKRVQEKIQLDELLLHDLVWAAAGDPVTGRILLRRILCR